MNTFRPSKLSIIRKFSLGGRYPVLTSTPLHTQAGQPALGFLVFGQSAEGQPPERMRSLQSCLGGLRPPSSAPLAPNTNFHRGHTIRLLTSPATGSESRAQGRKPQAILPDP